MNTFDTTFGDQIDLSPPMTDDAGIAVLDSWSVGAGHVIPSRCWRPPASECS